MEPSAKIRLFLQSLAILTVGLSGPSSLAEGMFPPPETSPYQLAIPRPAEVLKPETPPAFLSLPYQKLVRKVAQKYKLDAALIHAVIAIESNHSATAVSPMGALGLMQVLPDTGRRYGASDLFNPAENLNAGAAYLRMLLDRYDQDLDLALAAYNAGEGAVDRHGRQIPKYRETQRYVPAVKARYELLSGRSIVRPTVVINPYRLMPDALEKISAE